jgi:hypothetical protein
MRRTKLAGCRLALTIVGMGATALLASGPVGAQQTEDALYHAVEGSIRLAYDQATQADATRKSYDRHVADFKRAQQQYSTEVPGNWADRLDADDWLKMFYYNEANMGVSCAQDAGLKPDDFLTADNELIRSKFLPCVSRGVQQMATFFQIDNLLLTYNTGKFSAECEPKARLVTRERSLPPYAFLKPKNPDAMRLMRFGVYLKCIIDRMGINPSMIGVDTSLLDG